MKAALLVEPGRVVVDEVPDLRPGPGEVRIAVRGVGLCGSDLSVYTGKWPAPSYPWVMGHEAFGVVDAVGEGVPEDRVGELVVVEPNVCCFVCEQCVRGRTSACLNRISVGMNRPGAIAEQLVLPSRFAWPAPVTDEDDLVCVEPTAVAATGIRRLGDLPDRVLVVGVGALGLIVSLVLEAKGVETATIDVNTDRLALSRELGARPVAEEERFEAVIDTVGAPGSVAKGFEHLAIGGTLLFLGLDSRTMGLDAQSVVRRQATLRGSLTYDHPADFAAALDLVRDGLRPGRAVTDRIDLEDAALAFANVAQARGKTWIRIG